MTSAVVRPTPGIFACVTILLLSMAGGALYAQANADDADLDDIFAQVFGDGGGTDAAVPAITVPVFINGSYAGDALVQPAFGEEPTLVTFTDLALLLAGAVDDDYVHALAGIQNAAGLVPVDAIAPVGIDAEYLAARLELRLTIPAVVRPQLVLRARSVGDTVVPDVRYSPVFSAYLNLSTQVGVQAYQYNEANAVNVPFSIALEPVFNFWGVVWESFMSIDISPTPAYRLDVARVVYDDRDANLRYEFGTVMVPASGLQPTRSLMGAMVSRTAELTPQARPPSFARVPFVVEQSGMVNVLLNERRVRSEVVEPGRYELLDISLTQGVNRIQVVDAEEENSENPRYLADTTIMFDNRLINPGVWSLWFAVGFPELLPSLLIARAQRVDPGEPSVLPTATVVARNGVSPDLTAGLWFSGLHNVVNLGGDFVWSSPIGAFSLAVAASGHTDYAAGLAVQAGYRITATNLSVAPSLGLAVQYSGDQYVSGSASAPAARPWTVGANAGLAIPGGPRFTLNGSYRFGGIQPAEFNGTLFLSQSLPDRGSVTANFSLLAGADEPAEPRFSLLFTLPPQGPRPGASTSYEYPTGTASASLQIPPALPIRRPSLNLNVRGFQSAANAVNSITVSSRYPDHRFEMDLTGAVAFPGEPPLGLPGVWSASLMLGFDSALVFADGVAALSRPVADSFLVVDAHPNLRGIDVGLDPAGGEFAAVVNDMAGVIPDLQPYRYRMVRIVAPDLPIGYDLGLPTVFVEAGFRSGLRYRVGTDATVVLRARLIGTDGEPLALTAAELTARPSTLPAGAAAGDPTTPAAATSDSAAPDTAAPDPTDSAVEPMVLFTNRAGEIEVPGLNPGRYRIALFDETTTVDFNIPPEAVGMFGAGDLFLGQTPNTSDNHTRSNQ